MENEKIMEKYLPLGSVVLLKKAKKRVMIVGYAVRGKESGNKIWDYVGCMYPEGLLSSDKNLLFNHNDINKVYALGFSDDEHVRYVEFIKNSVKTIQESNQ